jgi:hypothetical protein
MSSTAWQAAAGAQTACDIGVAGCAFRYPVARIDLGRRQMTGVRMAWQVIGPGPADAFVNARSSPRLTRSPGLIPRDGPRMVSCRRRAAV